MILFFVWIQLVVECLAIPAELQKDRYVVREHKSFEMDCIHKLETVTRVTWEYISTHNNNNRSETIYDSQQPNNILKSGFEVSCQPHEAFISTCIVKLVHARKEDTGKYICYIGRGNETKFDSNMLKPITEIELVVKGPIHKTVLANNGDSVILPCEHNIKNLTRARWSHVSIHGVLTYAVYHMPAKETSNKNYEALCEPHELSCNLKILQADKESAGRYICMVGESLEFEEKYGLDQMTHFIEIQFVVGELECNKNMNKDVTLIGENDCYGIEADVLNLKCSFNYFGNINYNLLHLRWIEKYKFNSLEKKLNSSPINHETNKISIQTNLSVAYDMRDSVFQCVLDDTKVKPCQLNEFRTQYIKNTTERYPLIHSDDLHKMKCLANKSANVQCSYYWVHEIAGAMVENRNAILPVNHMNSPGIYTCIAKCQLGNNKECIIKAMEVEVVHGPQLMGIMIGLINGLILGVEATIIIVFVVLKKFKNEKFGNLFRKFFLNNQKDYRNDLPEQETLSEKDSTLSAFKEKQIIQANEPNIKLLLEKNTLHYEISNYHKIKIYDSHCNGRVLMLDNAIWMTELGSMSQKVLIYALLLDNAKCPKDVLVIGGGDGTIVKKLLRYPKVESITVYEHDEHIIELGYKYFPSITCYLDDSKVKVHIGDGNEFITKQENAFDVIIIRSTEVQASYLVKEYYENIKNALKEGGVASLFVDGPDTKTLQEDDIMKTRVLDLCEQIFPVVYYVPFPFQEHPGTLTRCIMCSLNCETLFKHVITNIFDVRNISTSWLEEKAFVLRKKQKKSADVY